MEDFPASPVSKTNKVEWTAQQRKLALDTDPVTTLSDIQPKARGV
jgi:hypothetical protein